MIRLYVIDYMALNNVIQCVCVYVCARTCVCVCFAPGLVNRLRVLTCMCGWLTMGLLLISKVYHNTLLA